MLAEWYNNGIVEAFIIYRSNRSSSLGVFEEGDFKKEFEELRNKKEEFEKFLNKNMETPLGNIISKKGNPRIKPIIKLSSKTKAFSKNGNFAFNSIFKVEDKEKKCFICDSAGTKLNTALLFPFERKVGLNFYTYFDEKRGRLRFCSLCQKILFYSFGNILYDFSKPKEGKTGRVTLFFSSSDDYEKSAIFSQKLKQIKISDIENDWYFKNIRPEGRITTFYPFEFLYPSLFTLYNWLEDKQIDKKEISNILSDIKIELISYIMGNLPIYDSYNSISRIDKIFMIFEKISNNVKELNLKRKDREPLKIQNIFSGFFNSLTIDAKKFEDRNRLRETFTKTLLKKHKVDYITLNEIVMQNTKRKEGGKFISFYELMIKSILEGLNMEEERTLFERINTSGYVIGAKAKEYLDESALWNVFRTRTPGDFYDSVVKTQLKLRISFDTREIAKYVIEDTSRWREIKAIFLNGMANALFGQEKSKEGGQKDGSK